MTQNYKLEKTKKQQDAIQLMIKNTICLLEGGGRSGKTLIILYAIIIRALKYEESRHLITRFRFAHAKITICYDTMPKLLKFLGLSGKVHLNKTDWFYEFPNKSTIWIGGLDDKERTEKILGNEYATIFLNEASQISYDSYEMIITRLNPPKKVKGMVLIDYNPPSIMHWGYKIFHERKFPDGRPVPENNYKYIRMNPKDNLKNISEDYINNLKNLSAAKRKRFLEGEYTLDIGKLWKREWIKYHKSKLPDFIRIVVGVDPAGSVGGDEVGIIVAGKYIENEKIEKYIVLDDYSLNGTPAQWAEEVAKAYKDWNADIVIAEKNYGGDMVESTIRNADKNINVKLVNASRGKIVRAEPISALYEHEKVTHRIPFMVMEDELCTYDPEISESPNRMDALVWAITALAGMGSYDISIPDIAIEGL